MSNKREYELQHKDFFFGVGRGVSESRGETDGNLFQSPYSECHLL